MEFTTQNVNSRHVDGFRIEAKMVGDKFSKITSLCVRERLFGLSCGTR